MIETLLKNFKRLKALIDITESTIDKKYYEITEIEVARTKLLITIQQIQEECFKNKNIIDKFETKEKPK